MIKAYQKIGMGFARASCGFLFVVGTVAASAMSADIVGGDVLPGARGEYVLSYMLGDGCASGATVESMTLVYEGDEPESLRRIYARIDGRIVTKRVAIDPSSGTVSLRFHHRYEPGACSGAIIDIYADISRTAEIGSEHRLVLELPQDVMTDEGGVGMPMQGPWLHIAR